MAKKSTTQVRGKKPARAAALPGMEDHAIAALEAVANDYAEIRDERMQLTTREKELKVRTCDLMHKHKKTIYRHNGVEITLVPGEEDVKVRVKKADDDDDDDEEGGTAEFSGAGVTQTEERRRAVDSDTGE